MSGMEPMLIGAMLGGGVSAARGGNPLTGALLGGIGGGVFGAASGAAGAATGGAAQAAGIAANPALSMGAMNTAAGSAMANPGLLATLKEVPSALQTFAKENPFSMNVASNMAQQDMQREAQRDAEMLARSGLMRGNLPPSQQQRPSFSVPQISLM
jgi:hypothetical protein